MKEKQADTAIGSCIFRRAVPICHPGLKEFQEVYTFVFTFRQRKMLRRQTRERRDYIFKKSQESQERAIWERKQKIKELLASGKPIPGELRADVREFGGKDLVLDEAQAGECFSYSSLPPRNELLMTSPQ